jgi:hypothetical protein
VRFRRGEAAWLGPTRWTVNIFNAMSPAILNPA